MKYIQLTYSEALTKQADLTNWLVSNGHVPESTEKYSDVIKHPIQDLGAIPILKGYTYLIAISGIFTQKQIADASELTADWFWHYPDRPIRLKLSTAKLIEQPYDGLFAYLRSAWQALGVIPYPVANDGNETIVYLEELTDINVDGQTITAEAIEALPGITVQRYN